MTAKEEVTMRVDAILVYSPEKELEVLARLANDGKEVDWKPAIIFSATYIEKLGIQKLKRYIEGKGITIDEKVEDLTLFKVASFLHEFGLIDHNDFTHINEIRKERNSMVHQKESNIAYVGESANEKYEKMKNNALRIITALRRNNH